MSAPVPVSFFVNFQDLTSVTRPAYLHELAVNGAKYVVLTSPLLGMILGDPELLPAVSRELEAAGLRFLDAHAPYGPRWDLNAPYESDRAAQSARLKAVMEIVASLGLDTMTMHMGTDLIAPELSAQQHFDRSCAMLETLLPTAERLGITICLENGMIRNYRTSTLLAVLEKFQSDHLGFCFDSGHCNLKIRTHYAESEKYASRMIALHLHDNDGTGDLHQPPFTGTFNWEWLAEVLKKADYSMPLNFEINQRRSPFYHPEKSDHTDDLRAFLADAKERCDKFVRMCAK